MLNKPITMAMVNAIVQPSSENREYRAYLRGFRARILSHLQENCSEEDSEVVIPIELGEIYGSQFDGVRVGVEMKDACLQGLALMVHESIPASYFPQKESEALGEKIIELVKLIGIEVPDVIGDYKPTAFSNQNLH